MVGIVYHKDLIQGSDEWLQSRCGILTASEMKLILTPTLKIASNDKERAHVFELAAQRLSNYVEPRYISDDMVRGQEDEVLARIAYAKHYAAVEECGFVTNNTLGFNIGYSPDGLTGDEGQIECKSRIQKYQLETILDGKMPDDYVLQVQTGLFVTQRKWCDFISYSSGMPMITIRVFPDPKYQEAIITAAKEFENRIQEKMDKYIEILATPSRLLTTERRIEQEMYVE